MSEWTAIFHAMREAGLSPAAIVIVAMVAYAIRATYERTRDIDERHKQIMDAHALREATAQKRQDAFNARVDNELKRMNARLERSEQDRKEIHKALEKSENELHKIETANLILERYKAVCEDACPLAAEIHKLRLPKCTPNPPST